MEDVGFIHSKGARRFLLFAPGLRLELLLGEQVFTAADVSRAVRWGDTDCETGVMF